MNTKQNPIFEITTVTQSQLALALGTTEWTIWRMRKDGKLPPALTVGRGGVRWRLDTIMKWMDEAERPSSEIAPGLRSRAASSVESRFGKREKEEGKPGRGRPTKQQQIEQRGERK